MNLKGKIYFMAILAVMLSVLGGNVTLANPIVTESTSNSTVKQKQIPLQLLKVPHQVQYLHLSVEVIQTYVRSG